MVPRTQMRFLADPAWSRDKASSWPCYILNTRVPHGGSAEMVVLRRSVRKIKSWKRQGPFFGGIPWAGVVAAGGEDRARRATGGAGAVETAPSSCGCALPAAFKNVLLQRLRFLSWFVTCSGNVHSLNSQIHIIRNFRQKEMSPFCVQLPFL